jgi:dolichol-phosphate mannosyltransferase
VLAGLAWEVVFVDDDSTDGSVPRLEEISRRDPRVRFLRRIGRRGLSTACLEGMLSTAAPYLAVMDADLQHDESLLPEMLQVIRAEQLDLVVGSRHLAAGGMGDFAAGRVRLSNLGALLSRLLPQAARLTDPMSGFFLLDRRFLERTLYRASGIGFKILLDLVASSPEPVRFKELPYRFGVRQHGESKLDLSVSVDYLYLLADKLIGRHIPVRFVVFVLAGLPGLALHLALLGGLMKSGGWSFLEANVAATMAAMTLNFFINNWFTYRDLRLTGGRLFTGLLTFYLACSIGALASFSIANFLFTHGAAWYLAGLTGMAVASVWNYAATRTLAWRARQRVTAYR